VLSIYPADSVAAPASVVLLVSARTEDHDSLRSIFRDSSWELQEAWTVSEGRRTLRRNHREIPVAICEDVLPDGDWKLLLAGLDRVAVRPSLIVSSRLADERLWAEVLNLGAFDLLLGAPFEPEEVLRVTESAWWARNHAARRRAVRRRAPGVAGRASYTIAKTLTAGSQI
jgi:DNA-binding NtrC family response regulator